MTYFYKKDGEVFIPEKINPDLVKLASAIVKTCKLTFKFQMKTTSLTNALKAGKREQLISLMQKCYEKNKRIYDQDMALAGVTIEEVEDSFFDDKDVDFLKAQVQILIDFAAINSVIESNLMKVLAASCEKDLGTPINKIKFFTNQDVILEEAEDEEETAE